MDRKDVEKIMGDGPGGVFTWREKNRKKVCIAYSLFDFDSHHFPG